MKKVLVVDDEQGIVLALEFSLANAGFHVISANSGEEALLLAKDDKPDVMLLDIMMPGFGGLETLKILRSHPDYKELPVILMSGARPLVRQAEYQWTEFVYKPFNVDDLIQKVQELANR